MATVPNNALETKVFDYYRAFLTQMANQGFTILYSPLSNLLSKHTVPILSFKTTETTLELCLNLPHLTTQISMSKPLKLNPSTLTLTLPGFKKGTLEVSPSGSLKFQDIEITSYSDSCLTACLDLEFDLITPITFQTIKTEGKLTVKRAPSVAIVADLYAEDAVFEMTHLTITGKIFTPGKTILCIEKTFTYVDNAFHAQEGLELTLQEGMDFTTPLKNNGYILITLAPPATRGFTLLADMAAGTKANPALANTLTSTDPYSNALVIDSLNYPITIGQEKGAYVTVISAGITFIAAKAIDLVHGTVLGDVSTQLGSLTSLHLGRKTPEGALRSAVGSGGELILQANDKMVWAELDLIAKKNALFRAPLIDNISSNVHLMQDALFNSPLTSHRILTSKQTGGQNINAHCPIAFQAYDTLGVSEQALTKPGFMFVGGTLTSTGETEILAYNIQYTVFEGKAPRKIEAFIPYKKWSEHRLWGHKKLSKAHWDHFTDKIAYDTPIMPVFSSSSTLTLQNTQLDVHSIITAPFIKCLVETANIGLSKRKVHIRLAAPKPFCMNVPLTDYAPQASALYRVTEAASISPTVFQPLLALELTGPLGPVIILHPNGSLTPNIHNLRCLHSSFQETQMVVQALMDNIGRGFLDDKTTEPQAMLKTLRENAYNYAHMLVPQQASTLETISSPMVVYIEREFIHLSGQKELVLIPFLRLPKSWNNPKLRDWAGGLFALFGLDMEGVNRNSSTLCTTAHLNVEEGKITFSHFKLIDHEQRTTKRIQTITDTTVRKELAGLSVKREKHTREVEITTLEPGNSLFATEVEYNNIGEINLTSLQVNIGRGGIHTHDISNITVNSLTTTSITSQHDQKRNDWGSLEATSHLVINTIHPTKIYSKGPVNLTASDMNITSLQVQAKKKVSLTSTHTLTLGATTALNDLPVHLRTKGLLCSKTSTQQEIGLPVCIISDESISLHAHGTLQGIAPQIISKADISQTGNQGVFLDVLRLRTYCQTNSSGISGLRYVKSHQREKHEAGILPLLQGKSIHIASKHGDVVLVSPIMLGTTLLDIKTPNGNIHLKTAAFEHDVLRKQFSAALCFFGSDALQLAMQGNFKAAAKDLLRQFPLLSDAELITKALCDKENTDLATCMTLSVKTLFDTYKMYSALSNAENLSEFLQGQLQLNPKVRLGSDTTHQHWTHLALPFLQASQICIEGKNIFAEGLQAEYETLRLVAKEKLNLKSAEQTYTSSTSGHGTTLGLNTATNMPNIGIDRNHARAQSIRHKNSHLSGKETHLIAGEAISLKGVLVKTLKALVQTKKLHLETVQDTLQAHQKSFGLSTDGSVSFASQKQDKKWATEQAGIYAEETLCVQIEQKLSLLGATLAVGASAHPLPSQCIDGTQTELYEYQIPRMQTQNCAFDCLGINRERATAQLIEHAGDLEVRALVAPEIEVALLSEKAEGLPEEMLDAETSILKEDFFDAQTALDNHIQALNRTHNQHGLNETQLQPYLSGAEKSNLAFDSLLLDFARNAIHDYATQESTFIDFVRYYVGKVGMPLGYLRAIGNEHPTSSMNAIAKLNNLNVRVWIQDETTGKLVVVHSYASNDAARWVDMHHTDNLTHFNLLHKEPGLIISPEIQHQDIENIHHTKSHSINISGPDLVAAAVVAANKNKAKNNPKKDEHHQAPSQTPTSKNKQPSPLFGMFGFDHKSKREGETFKSTITSNVATSDMDIRGLNRAPNNSKITKQTSKHHSGVLIPLANPKALAEDMEKTFSKQPVLLKKVLPSLKKMLPKPIPKPVPFKSTLVAPSAAATTSQPTVAPTPAATQTTPAPKAPKRVITRKPKQAPTPTVAPTTPIPPTPPKPKRGRKPKIQTDTSFLVQQEQALIPAQTTQTQRNRNESFIEKVINTLIPAAYADEMPQDKATKETATQKEQKAKLASTAPKKALSLQERWENLILGPETYDAPAPSAANDGGTGFTGFTGFRRFVAAVREAKQITLPEDWAPMGPWMKTTSHKVRFMKDKNGKTIRKDIDNRRFSKKAMDRALDSLYSEEYKLVDVHNNINVRLFAIQKQLWNYATHTDLVPRWAIGDNFDVGVTSHGSFEGSIGCEVNKDGVYANASGSMQAGVNFLTGAGKNELGEGQVEVNGPGANLYGSLNIDADSNGVDAEAAIGGGISLANIKGHFQSDKVCSKDVCIQVILNCGLGAGAALGAGAGYRSYNNKKGGSGYLEAILGAGVVKNVHVRYVLTPNLPTAEIEPLEEESSLSTKNTQQKHERP